MATMEGLLTWPVFGVIVLSILVGSILAPCWDETHA